MSCTHASDSRHHFFSGGILCALSLLCITCARSIVAQQDPTPGLPTTTMTVQANLIQIPVLVLTGDRERIDSSIDASRFSIRLGDGRWTHPKFARREGDDPIDLAIVIDLRAPQHDVLPKLEEAIAGLVATSLNSRDHVSIYVTGCSTMHAVEGVPLNAERLRLSVGKLLRSEKNSGNASCKTGNNLWDALAYVVRELSTQPGRRTILAVTNGDDQKSRYAPQTLAELAQRSGVSVFGLNSVFHSSSAFALQSPGEQLLANMTEASGGMTLNLESQSISKELKRFVQMLRDRYIVEFRRPADAAAGKIDFAVSVIGPNYFVRSAGKSVPVANSKDDDRTVRLAAAEEPTPRVEAPASSQASPAVPIAAASAAAPAVANPVIAAAPAMQQPVPLEETTPLPATASLTVSTRLTVEDVTVSDSKQVPVRGLTRTDFELKEDGKVQTIKNFEENGAPGNGASPAPPLPAAGAPLSLSVATNILLLDEVTTGLSKGLSIPQESFAYARQQALRYLKNLPAGTPVAILQLGDNLRVLQDLTSDKARLIAAVNAASFQPVARTYVVQRSPGAACDAANIQSEIVVNGLDGLADYLSAIKGRKNVIWFTPGVPWLTQYQQFSTAGCLRDYSAQLYKAYLQLNSARVALYPIDPRGVFSDPAPSAATPIISPIGSSGIIQPSYAPPLQQAAAFGGNVQNDNASLTQMAEATGGMPYFNRNDLDAALREAIATGADYYSLAYVPPLSVYDGKFHSISVHVDKPNLQLEYRRGYVSIDPAKVPNTPQVKH